MDHACGFRAYRSNILQQTIYCILDGYKIYRWVYHEYIGPLCEYLGDNLYL